MITYIIHIPVSIGIELAAQQICATVPTELMTESLGASPVFLQFYTIRAYTSDDLETALWCFT